MTAEFRLPYFFSQRIEIDCRDKTSGIFPVTTRHNFDECKQPILIVSDLRRREAANDKEEVRRLKNPKKILVDAPLKEKIQQQTHSKQNNKTNNQRQTNIKWQQRHIIIRGDLALQILFAACVDGLFCQYQHKIENKLKNEVGERSHVECCHKYDSRPKLA